MFFYYFSAIFRRFFVGGKEGQTRGEEHTAVQKRRNSE
jgi:hypothetical protein